MSRDGIRWKRWIGLPAGPVLGFLAAWAVPETMVGSGGEAIALGAVASSAAFVASWMAVWWLTEVVDVSITALLPIVLFPLLEVAPIGKVTAAWGRDLIYLFLGGFLLSLSMEKWGLHRRIARVTLRIVGTNPQRVVLGFMSVTALLSMWVSNTATAVMMLPVGLSVVELARRASERVSTSTPEDVHRFSLCIMLGIAWGCSIGGIGTLIGTPPNLFLASYLRDNQGIEIGFAQWMLLAVPIVLVLIPAGWWLLTRRMYPFQVPPIVSPSGDAGGPLNRGEWATLIVFVSCAVSWIARPWLVGLEVFGHRPLSGLTDTGIAMAAAMLLFVWPTDRRMSGFVLEWDSAGRIPWGVLVLFGGGFALADGIESSGLGQYIGSTLSFVSGYPPVLVVAVIVLFVIFLSELTSNTATAATFVPVLATLAPQLGVSTMLLVVPATLAASLAFMLPVGTPPNAVVFSTGHVTVREMARAGFWLNLISAAILVAFGMWVVVPILGE